MSLQFFSLPFLPKVQQPTPGRGCLFESPLPLHVIKLLPALCHFLLKLLHLCCWGWPPSEFVIYYFGRFYTTKCWKIGFQHCRHQRQWGGCATLWVWCIVLCTCRQTCLVPLTSDGCCPVSRLPPCRGGAHATLLPPCHHGDANRLRLAEGAEPEKGRGARPARVSFQFGGLELNLGSVSPAQRWKKNMQRPKTTVLWAYKQVFTGYVLYGSVIAI